MTEPTGTVWDEPRLAAVHVQADKAVRVRRMFDAATRASMAAESL